MMEETKGPGMRFGDMGGAFQGRYTDVYAGAGTGNNRNFAADKGLEILRFGLLRHAIRKAV